LPDLNALDRHIHAGDSRCTPHPHAMLDTRANVSSSLRHATCEGADRLRDDRAAASTTGSVPMRTVLLVILILLLLGALPTWPYSTGWGYYPSGGLAIILILLIVFGLMGRR
jgi:hypothetical protein